MLGSGRKPCHGAPAAPHEEGICKLLGAPGKGCLLHDLLLMALGEDVHLLTEDTGLAFPPLGSHTDLCSPTWQQNQHCPLPAPQWQLHSICSTPEREEPFMD